jgi:hypothetical protein
VYTKVQVRGKTDQLKNVASKKYISANKVDDENTVPFQAVNNFLQFLRTQLFVVLFLPLRAGPAPA